MLKQLESTEILLAGYAFGYFSFLCSSGLLHRGTNLCIWDTLGWSKVFSGYREMCFILKWDSLCCLWQVICPKSCAGQVWTSTYISLYLSWRTNFFCGLRCRKKPGYFKVGQINSKFHRQIEKNRNLNIKDTFWEAV